MPDRSPLTIILEATFIRDAVVIKGGITVIATSRVIILSTLQYRL